jgi:hypothetical protein
MTRSTFFKSAAAFFTGLVGLKSFANAAPKRSELLVDLASLNRRTGELYENALGNSVEPDEWYADYAAANATKE